MYNYYKHQLDNINIKSECISIKIIDFEGNKTKYFDLNNESIKELKNFIHKLENNNINIKKRI